MIQLVEPQSQNDLLALAVQTLDELLPDGWETSLLAASDDPYADRRRSPDALLEVIAPDGTSSRFALVARLSLAGREAASAIALLRRWAEDHETDSMLVSRYLSSTAREFCVEGDASFVDATGNVRIACARPAIAIVRPGLERNPWRGAVARSSLRGAPAAKVIRAVCEHSAPIETARLIELAGASVGAAYRVIDMLIDEGLVTKGDRGWIDAVEWPGALERWARDQSLGSRRGVQRFTLPDGTATAIAALKLDDSPETTIGGGHAASFHDGIEPVGHLYLHSGDPLKLARHLDAMASNDGELWIDSRWPDLAARGASIRGKLSYAAPAQAYADLITASAPARRTGKLRDWMRQHEADWRDAD